MNTQEKVSPEMFMAWFDLHSRDKPRGRVSITFNGGPDLSPSLEQQQWMGQLRKSLRGLARKAKIPFKTLYVDYSTGACLAINGKPSKRQWSNPHTRF